MPSFASRSPWRLSLNVNSITVDVIGRGYGSIRLLKRENLNSLAFQKCRHIDKNLLRSNLLPLEEIRRHDVLRQQQTKWNIFTKAPQISSAVNCTHVSLFRLFQDACHRNCSYVFLYVSLIFLKAFYAINLYVFGVFALAKNSQKKKCNFKAGDNVLFESLIFTRHF